MAKQKKCGDCARFKSFHDFPIYGTCYVTSDSGETVTFRNPDSTDKACEDFELKER